MDITFEGKHALVTGAGQGFGRCIATKLYKGGATVYALDISKPALDSLVEELPEIKSVVVDLSDWDAARKAVQDIGPIDLLVNNAGIYINKSPMATTEALIDEIFSINLKAAINVTQVVAESMIARGSGGSIVNTSSVASKKSGMSLAYGLSKVCLDHATRMFAVELGKHKIRINTVNPSLVMTPLGKANSTPELVQALKDNTPMGELAQIEDVANAVLYLLSDKSNFITGESLCVDGGLAAK